MTRTAFLNLAKSSLLIFALLFFMTACDVLEEEIEDEDTEEMAEEIEEEEDVEDEEDDEDEDVELSSEDEEDTATYTWPEYGIRFEYPEEWNVIGRDDMLTLGDWEDVPTGNIELLTSKLMVHPNQNWTQLVRSYKKFEDYGMEEVEVGDFDMAEIQYYVPAAGDTFTSYVFEANGVAFSYRVGSDEEEQAELILESLEALDERVFTWGGQGLTVEYPADWNAYLYGGSVYVNDGELKAGEFGQADFMLVHRSALELDKTLHALSGRVSYSEAEVEIGDYEVTKVYYSLADELGPFVSEYFLEADEGFYQLTDRAGDEEVAELILESLGL